MQDDIRAFMPYPAHPVPHAHGGPLSGMTFAVKDLFDVAGYPTGGGNPHLLALSGIKSRTAPVVQRLLDSGARFMGKTHTSELAYSDERPQHAFTAPRATARRRITSPAAPLRVGLGGLQCGLRFCSRHRHRRARCARRRATAGCSGLRPSHGGVSLDGCQPLCATMDTCGFFARSAEVFRAVAECLLRRRAPGGRWRQADQPRGRCFRACRCAPAGAAAGTPASGPRFWRNRLAQRTAAGRRRDLSRLPPDPGL
ncbi:Amidase [Raoultella terrigena]|uniref:Amidase n=1 Tax=Raoultella terrigena TaxID=577 RepID=A0A4U9D9P8_RAOTE|nr:Amidase [Raoultella terrigena]